jgi:hypothetical protein
MWQVYNDSIPRDRRKTISDTHKGHGFTLQHHATLSPISRFGDEAREKFQEFILQGSKFPAFGERLNILRPEEGPQEPPVSNYEEKKLLLLQFQKMFNLNVERSYLVPMLIQYQIQETQEFEQFSGQKADIQTELRFREYSDTIKTHTMDQSNFNSLQEVQSQYYNMNPIHTRNNGESQMENGTEATSIEITKEEI